MRDNDTPTPLHALAQGLLAGAAGTAAMTAAQTALYRIQGSEGSTTPAEVAKRVIRGVFHRRVDERHTDRLNTLMHVGYGTGWGIPFGITMGSIDASPLPAGLIFGTAVWAASLVELPLMKLAPPVWRYSPGQLASDLGFHLVYGLGAATAWAVVDR